MGSQVATAARWGARCLSTLLSLPPGTTPGFLRLCWLPWLVPEAETRWTHLTSWSTGLGSPHLPADFKWKAVGRPREKGRKKNGGGASALSV